MSITGADIKKVQKITEDFLERLKVNIKAEVSANTDGIKINLQGKDSAILIGYHGETLSDLAYILGQIIRSRLKKDDRVRVDVNNYLEGKDKKIADMTMRAIDKVRHSGFPEDISGLNAYERRVAHTVVAREGLKSESIGFGKDRKIVIKPASFSDFERDED